MKQNFFEAGATYHLFNRGNNKEDIFKEDKNYYYFLSLMQKYLLPVAEIYAYCLLKNHFHLVVRIKDFDALPKQYQEKPYVPISNLFNAYTKSINKLYNRTGSLFQEHLHRTRVETDEYLIQLIAYVHLNPIKHGFLSDYKSYRHSSFRAYELRDKATSISREYILEFFNGFENMEYWHDLNKLYMLENIEDV